MIVVREDSDDARAWSAFALAQYGNTSESMLGLSALDADGRGPGLTGLATGFSKKFDGTTTR
jgi:hypothetical protein